MYLFFIRHAQSVNNALWDATGSDCGRSSDPELTPLGHAQARTLATYLADYCNPGESKLSGISRQLDGFRLTHLYTSLMIRAVQTACEIGHTIGLRPQAWLDLHETGGIFLEDLQTGELNGLPGKDRAYFETYHPDLILPETWKDGGWWERPFERDADRPLRAGCVVDELLRRHGSSDDRVAIVSHGGFYNHLLNAIFHLPSHHESERWFLMHNTGITAIEFRQKERVLLYANRLEHLPQELIT